MRDDHGNCEFCESGYYQPRDYRPESVQKAQREVDDIYDHYEWLLNKHKQDQDRNEAFDAAQVTCLPCEAGSYANKLIEFS
jgi:hypothetical protein